MKCAFFEQCVLKTLSEAWSMFLCLGLWCYGPRRHWLCWWPLPIFHGPTCYCSAFSFCERHFSSYSIPRHPMDSRVRNYAGDHNITITSDPTLDTYNNYNSQSHSSYSSANDKYDTFRQRRRDVNKINGQYKPYDDGSDLMTDYDSSYLKATRKRTALEEKSRKRDLKIALALTLWACYIRLWKIWQPSSVVLVYLFASCCYCCRGRLRIVSMY